jgi:hypothetical protein
MSLAIGVWLYDANADYSKNSKSLNQAMLAAMKRESTTYDDTPEVVLNPLGIYTSKSKQSNSSIVKTDIKNIGKRSKIPADMSWILK